MLLGALWRYYNTMQVLAEVSSNQCITILPRSGTIQFRLCSDSLIGLEGANGSLQRRIESADGSLQCSIGCMAMPELLQRGGTDSQVRAGSSTPRLLLWPGGGCKQMIRLSLRCSGVAVAPVSAEAPAGETTFSLKFKHASQKPSGVPAFKSQTMSATTMSSERTLATTQ